jgi:hypothetical protein
MQKKLSKHFIYRWLQEDLYGEYTLHHFNSKFSNRLLLNLWNFLNNVKWSKRTSLVLGLKSNRYLDFVASSLRYKSLLLATSTIARSSFYFVSRKKLLKLKTRFYGTLLSNNSPTISLLVFTPLTAFSKLSTSFRIKIKHLLARKNKTIFLNTIKYRWRKFKRVRRSRSIVKLSKSASLPIFFKRGRFIFLKNGKKWKNANRWTARTTTFKNTLLKKKIKFAKNYKRNFIRYAPRKLGKFRRSYKFLTHPNLRLWRYLTRFKKVGELKTAYTLRPGFNTNYPKLIRPQILLTSSLINLKNYSLNFTWDNLSYKLKQRIRRFTQTSRGVRKFLLNVTHTKLKFKGTFQKNVALVKKNEINKILNFRLLNYFNLVTTPNGLNTTYYNLYYQSKVFQLPSPTALEFHIVPTLLRSGFFENGYIAHSLIKRGVFLLNGSIVNENLPLKVWDIISLTKPIWWLVYARFINFFTGFRSLTNSASKQIIKRPNFLPQLLRFKNLFKKFDYRNKISTKGALSKLLYLKNYVFSLPPAYMEVSYKMFIFVIYRLANKSNDIAIPFNRRGLKTLSSAPSMRALS